MTFSSSILALSLLAPQGGPLHPADAIPADSWVVAEFAGLTACREAADGLDLPRLAEQVARPARDRVLDQARRQLERLDGRLTRIGIDRQFTRAVLARPVALGVGRPVLFDESLLPGVAIVLDVKGREQEADAAVERLATIARERMGLTVERVAGPAGPTTHATHPRRAGHLVAAREGGLLLLSNAPRYLQECVACLRGGASASEPRSDGRLLSASLNLAPFMALLPYDIEDVLRVLGGHHARRVELSIGVDGQLAVDRVRLLTEGEPGGVAAALLPGPVQSAGAAYCPADTLTFASGRMNGPAVVASARAFWDALPSVARHELSREVRREIGEAVERLATRAQELEALGEMQGTWTVAGPVPSLANPMPRVVGVLEVDDAEGVAKALRVALAGLASGAGDELQVARFRDLQIHYASVEAGVRFTPSICVHEGVVVFASDLRMLKAALVRKLDGQPSLATVAGDRGWSIAGMQPAVTYQLRLSQAVEMYWPLVESLVSGMPRESLGMLDLDALPETDEMVAAVGDVRLGAARHGRGIDLIGESPFGLGVVLATIGRLADDVLAVGVD